MSDAEKRQYARQIALQTLYRTRQREHGRLLLSTEMAQALRDADEFVEWFFGSAATSEEKDRN